MRHPECGRRGGGGFAPISEARVERERERESRRRRCVGLRGSPFDFMRASPELIIDLSLPHAAVERKFRVKNSIFKRPREEEEEEKCGLPPPPPPSVALFMGAIW